MLKKTKQKSLVFRNYKDVTLELTVSAFLLGVGSQSFLLSSHANVTSFVKKMNCLLILVTMDFKERYLTRSVLQSGKVWTWITILFPRTVQKVPTTPELEGEAAQENIIL